MGKIFVSLMAVILLAACGSVVYKPVVYKSVDKNQEKLGYAKEISNDEPTEIIKAESINIAKITDILSQFPVKNPKEVNIRSYVTNMVNKKADFFEPFKDGLLAMGEDPAGFWTTCRHVSHLKYNGQWESIFKESAFGNYLDDPSMQLSGKWLAYHDVSRGTRVINIESGEIVYEKMFEQDKYSNREYHSSACLLKNDRLFYCDKEKLFQIDLKEPQKIISSIKFGLIIPDEIVKIMENSGFMSIKLFEGVEERIGIFVAIGNGKSFIAEIDNLVGEIYAIKSIPESYILLGQNDHYYVFCTSNNKIRIIDRKMKLRDYDIAVANDENIRFINDNLLVVRSFLFDVQKRTFVMDFVGTQVIKTSSGRIVFSYENNFYCYDANTSTPLWKVGFGKEYVENGSINEDYISFSSSGNVYCLSCDTSKMYVLGYPKAMPPLMEGMPVPSIDQTCNVYLDTVEECMIIGGDIGGSFYRFGSPEPDSLSIYPSILVHPNDFSMPEGSYSNFNVNLVWNGQSEVKATIDYGKCNIPTQTIDLNPGQPVIVNVKSCDDISIKVGELTYRLPLEQDQSGD